MSPLGNKRSQSVLKSPSAISHRLPKGQSVIEFLMTYGWALIIIVIILAVLFYLGILNPKNTYANTCLFPPGISCYTFKIGNGTGSLYLDLGQATGKSALITGLSCSRNESASIESLLNNVTIKSGEHRWLIAGDSGNFHRCKDGAGNNLSGSAAELGERYKGRICIQYNELETTGAVGTARLACGDVTARIEPNQVVSGEGCSPGCALGSGCSSSSQCSTQYCNTTSGLCSACTDNSQCATGYCSGGTCTQCTSSCPDGATCTNNSQCQSGYCISGTCQQPTAGWFYGTVSGSVISGATVNASNATGYWTNTTNSSGQYIIYGLSSGEYNLNASKSGYLNSTATASITAGSGTGVNFTLQQAVSSCAPGGFWLGPGYWVLLNNVSAGTTCINIENTENVTLDCQGFSVSGIGSASIWLNHARNVTVKNCNSGLIELDDANDSRVINNNITTTCSPSCTTPYGIQLSSSNHNTMTGNRIWNITNAVYLTSSSTSNTFSNNTVTGNTNGIYADPSSGSNTISINVASNNVGYGIYTLSNNNVITGNTASNQTVYQGIAVGGSGNTINGNTACNNTAGGDIWCSGTQSPGGSNTCDSLSGCGIISCNPC